MSAGVNITAGEGNVSIGGDVVGDLANLQIIVVIKTPSGETTLSGNTPVEVIARMLEVLKNAYPNFNIAGLLKGVAAKLGLSFEEKIPEYKYPDKTSCWGEGDHQKNERDAKGLCIHCGRK